MSIVASSVEVSSFGQETYFDIFDVIKIVLFEEVVKFLVTSLLK